MPASDLITPGLTLCGRCRTRPAVLALTDPGALTRRAAEPELLCFECLEAELERERARAVSPEAAVLQALAAGELERPLHLTYTAEQMLERLSTPAAKQRAGRCHAILPSGQRCGRPATVPGRYSDAALACETCANLGRPTPGLGWTEAGEPKGRPVPFRRAA